MTSRCNATMEEAKTRVMCVHVRGQPDVTFVYVFSKINHIRAGSGIKGMWSRYESARRIINLILHATLLARGCTSMYWDFVDIPGRSSTRIIGADGDQIHPRDGIRPIGNKYIMIW